MLCRAWAERFVIPVTVDDLAANGLLEGDHPQTCWERSVETLTARKEEIAGLAVASDERIEAYILYIKDEIVALRTLVRGRGSPSEPATLPARRRRHADCEDPSGGNPKGIARNARFPARRRPSALRREGAIRLGPRA